MLQEDLIYRITKAVFSRLGDKVDARLVSQAVKDLELPANDIAPWQR